MLERKDAAIENNMSVDHLSTVYSVLLSRIILEYSSVCIQFLSALQGIYSCVMKPNHLCMLVLLVMRLNTLADEFCKASSQFDDVYFSIVLFLLRFALWLFGNLWLM